MKWTSSIYCFCHTIFSEIFDDLIISYCMYQRYPIALARFLTCFSLPFNENLLGVEDWDVREDACSVISKNQSYCSLVIHNIINIKMRFVCSLACKWSQRYPLTFLCQTMDRGMQGTFISSQGYSSAHPGAIVSKLWIRFSDEHHILKLWCNFWFQPNKFKNRHDFVVKKGTKISLEHLCLLGISTLSLWRYV